MKILDWTPVDLLETMGGGVDLQFTRFLAIHRNAFN